MTLYHGSNVEVKQLYNQLVFVTTKALKFIRFKRSEVVG